MRFSVCEAFLKFFAEHQVIEFSEIFSSDEIDLLTQQVETALQQSLGKKPLDIASNLDLWKAGRNLHLLSDSLQKMLTKSPIAQILPLLYKKKSPIRIAYTQTFFSVSSDLPLAGIHSLAETSSIDPMLGGALICLSNQGEKPEENKPDLRHQQKGHVFFFSDQYPIPFAELFAKNGLKCLLLGFAPSQVRYKFQPLDIHTHALKRSGYVFGDSIQEKDCPYFCY
jgi:hypothetical protein